MSQDPQCGRRSNPQQRRRQPRVRLVVTAPAVVAVLMVAGCGGSSSPSRHVSPTPHGGATSSGGPTSSLAHFSGTGNETTTKFSAATNWEISWNADAGSRFTATLIDTNGASRGAIVTAGKKTSGATFVSLAGTFRIKVTAKGHWSITIIGRHA